MPWDPVRQEYANFVPALSELAPYSIGALFGHAFLILGSMHF
jgi:hypothetical protein